MDTADLTVLRDRLLDLLCEFAYREGDFVLSSGQKSSYYINCKPVTLHPEGALATGKLLLSMLAAWAARRSMGRSCASIG